MKIKNKKVRRNYTLEELWSAGIILEGSEIKSIRDGKVSLEEAWCHIKNDEVFVRNMHIAPYENAGSWSPDPVRERKLLMKKKEIAKMQKMVGQKGLTIVVVDMAVGKYAKLTIAVGRGKKTYDKRQDLKKKDAEREKQRIR